MENSLSLALSQGIVTLYMCTIGSYCHLLIRLQEGYHHICYSISLASSTPQTVPPFKLDLFRVLWSCLHRCWSEEVFLPALVHRFWKLTLQVRICCDFLQCKLCLRIARCVIIQSYMYMCQHKICIIHVHIMSI